MKFILIFFFFSFNFTLICAQGLFEWEQTVKENYPDSNYLSAIGMGDNRDEAEKDALSKISLIFISKINVDQSFFESTIEKTINDESNFLSESNSSKWITIGSNQTLFNVKYGNTYTATNGEIYIIAFINRAETSFMYAKKIDFNDKRINMLFQEALKSNDKIIKYSMLSQGEELIKNNLIFIQQLDIIEPSFIAVSEYNINYDKIINKKREVAKSIVFSLSKSMNIEIHNSIIDVLTNRNFMIGTNGDFYVTSIFNYDMLDLGRKEIFFTWSLSIKFFKEESIAIIYKDWGRRGAITEAIAIELVKREAINSISKNLNNKMDIFFNALEKD